MQLHFKQRLIDAMFTADAPTWPSPTGAIDLLHGELLALTRKVRIALFAAVFILLLAGCAIGGVRDPMAWSFCSLVSALGAAMIAETTHPFDLDAFGEMEPLHVRFFLEDEHDAADVKVLVDRIQAQRSRLRWGDRQAIRRWRTERRRQQDQDAARARLYAHRNGATSLPAQAA